MTDEQNTTPNEKQILRDLLPAYSLGLTDPDETRTVEALLSAHPDWSDEIQAERDDYAALADVLLHSAEPIAPPPALRARLLTQAEPVRDGPLSASLSWLVMGMAAAMIAVLALNVALLVQLADLESETDSLRAQLDNQSTFLSRYARQDYVEFAVADAREIDLPQEQTTHGFLRCNPDSNVALLEVENLPPISDENAYQVWLIQGDKRISGGLIATKDGHGMLVIYAPEPLGNYSYIGITREPATGSDVPTSDPVARASLYDS